ncbi:MAG: transcription termination/antitermination NusG family protein [Ginsengibacter sp.]
MQKNWYAVYTKPNCEKKIAVLFNRWKIENFYPLNSVKSNVSRKVRMVYEPLFKSYLFVCISEDQMPKLRRIEGVVNFLYWLGKPAIINSREIEIIREFSNQYSDIKIQRIKVDAHDPIQIIDEPSYTIEGKFISVKIKSAKVKLPSLGYSLTAEVKKEGVPERQNSLLNNISSEISHTHLNTA